MQKNNQFQTNILGLLVKAKQNGKLSSACQKSEGSLDEGSGLGLHKDAILQAERYMGVNQVLRYQSRLGASFFIPAYLRMRIIRVNKINYLEAAAEIEAEMKISLMIKQFPEEVQEKIINYTRVSINKGQSEFIKDFLEESFREVSNKKNISDKVVEFKVKKSLMIDIQSNPFLAPFQLIKLVTFAELIGFRLGSNYFPSKKDFRTQKSILNSGHEEQRYWQRLTQEEEKKYSNAFISFNFMDAHPFLQFSFSELRNLGSFDLAESMVDMEFSCEPFDGNTLSVIKNDEQTPLLLVHKIMNQDLDKRAEEIKSEQIQPMQFCYGKVLLPLYRFPGTTIISIFLPFYLLSILLLGIFFEKNDMTNRSASIATLQIAFIAFFPTIRSNLPETPKIVFAQILIYVQAICTLLCFGQSLYINQDPNFEFNWRKDIPFLISLGLTVFNISIVFMLLLIHKCYWEPKYNKMPQGTEDFLKETNLNTDQWENPLCQEEFKEYFQLGYVQPAFNLAKSKRNQRMRNSILSAKKRTKILPPLEIKRNLSGTSGI